MMREELVFGPIHSRRLGSSLGINLLPTRGKLCNFDCIYCECGWNKDGKGDRRLPSADELRVALDAKLKECAALGIQIDSITFSGDGEPTLNPDFANIIDITLELRNRYFPNAKVSVLSNATRTYRTDVFEALTKVDNPILKIDAPTDALAAIINQPQGEYHVEDIVQYLMKFEGNFVLQTMFLKSPDFDSSSPEVLDGWMNIVRRLRPREIMVYTLDRVAPAANLEKFSEACMNELVKPLREEGFVIQVRG
ncbi:MAG TPA: radical SAM protein [Rikenellaceae bacterium]|nr:radical SAM protein [Rikenellaceae bacterium]HCQ72705.1 radical SAM protein [Rikenellaceae bacterium]